MISLGTNHMPFLPYLGACFLKLDMHFCGIDKCNFAYNICLQSLYYSFYYD